MVQLQERCPVTCNVAKCCGADTNDDSGAPTAPTCGIGVSCCDSLTTNLADHSGGAMLTCAELHVRGGCADLSSEIRLKIHTLCPKACGLCTNSDGDGGDGGDGGAGGAGGAGDGGADAAVAGAASAAWGEC